MAKLLYRIGGFAARRAWVMIVAWVVILAALAGAYTAFKGELSDNITIPGTKAAQVQDDMADHFDVNTKSGTGQVILQTDGGKATTAQKEAVAKVLKKVDGIDGVDSTTNPYTTAQQMADAKKKIADGKKQLTSGQQQIDAAKKQLASAQTQLDQARSQVPDGAPASATAQLDTQQKQLDAQKKQLAAKQTELDKNKKTLEQNEKKLKLSSGYTTVSSDGTTALATVTFDQEINDVSPDTLSEVRSDFTDADLHGLSIQFDQNLEGQLQISEIGEIVGLLVGLIILLIMLGTLIAAGLPVVMAMVGVGAAYLGSMALSGSVSMTTTTPTLGTMLGIAVGIDYSLFILNRHRNNLAQGMEMKQSIALATGTSGNAVVFAGTTVIIALLGLNVVGIPFLSTMGNVAAFSVFMAVCVATTLTPAVLSLAGRRIMTKKRWNTLQRRNARRAAAEREQLVGSNEFHDRAEKAAKEREERPNGWLRVILKAPVVTVIVAVLALGVVAVPVTQIQLGLPTGASQSKDTGGYKSYKIIEDKFGVGRNGTVIVAADLPSGTTKAQAETLQTEVGQYLLDQDDVSAVVPAAIATDNSMLLFQLVPSSGPNDQSTTDLVRHLRDLTEKTSEGDVTFGVTGQTAINIDISDKLLEALPVYLALVIGLSLLVLILVFRSIWVPLTATIGFLFSLLAALGATVAVFQWGWLGFLFNLSDPSPIVCFLPILAIGILFGLAMDYQMFLVSSMREAYSHGHANRTSVVVGYNHSAKVVVAAALIMTGVFTAFIFTGNPTVASLGFVLAAGVLLDAFVIRMTLIPALMHMLGTKAWWFPKWLDRILPDVDVEGASLERQGQGHRSGTHDAADSHDADGHSADQHDAERRPAH